MNEMNWRLYWLVRGVAASERNQREVHRSEPRDERKFIIAGLKETEAAVNNNDFRVVERKSFFTMMSN